MDISHICTSQLSLIEKQTGKNQHCYPENNKTPITNQIKHGETLLCI